MYLEKVPLTVAIVDQCSYSYFIAWRLWCSGLALVLSWWYGTKLWGSRSFFTDLLVVFFCLLMTKSTLKTHWTFGKYSKLHIQATSAKLSLEILGWMSCLSYSYDIFWLELCFGLVGLLFVCLVGFLCVWGFFKHNFVPSSMFWRKWCFHRLVPAVSTAHISFKIQTFH